jgi:hypothetical protein
MLPGVDREPVVVRAAKPGDADQLKEIYGTERTMASASDLVSPTVSTSTSPGAR